MLGLRKRFSQRVCSIQIRMYFANLDVTILDVVPRHMETSENVLGCRVSPWFPCISNGACIIAINANRVITAWEYSKFNHELLQLERFIWRFASGYVLRFHWRLSDDWLLATPSAYCASGQHEYVSRLRFWVIGICTKTSIGVTFYGELFFTSSIDKKHILSSIQVLKDVLNCFSMLHSRIAY